MGSAQRGRGLETLSRIGRRQLRAGPLACSVRRPMGPWFVIALHVIVSVFLMFVILLQPGKGDAMAALGGGGSSTSVFGGRGSVTFLAKVTEICAAIFMITSLTLAYRSSHSDSVMRANRNIAADAAAKKTTGSDKPALPTGQTAPAPARDGAAVPVPGNQVGGPAAPTANPGTQKSAPGKQDASPSRVPAQTPSKR
jgi:preprotein translocase subunit SecG